MSNNGFEGPRETTPHRARHQISRSISELSSPIRLHRHHSHHPTKEKEPDGRGLSPVPQTASMTQTRVSLDGSRYDGPAQNPDPTSRRASIVMSSDAPNGMPGTTTTSFNGPSSMTVSKGATEQVLLKERQKAIARESGLKKSFSELEDISMATTRRFEDTYYSVLEKLGTLQNTIVALKELAGLSREMNLAFTTEAEELVTDVGSQLDGFGQFEDQQRRIEKLQSRISAGRDRIKILSKRVDVVGERIENWENADKEWQERTRKRLKAVWVVTSILLFIFLALFLSVQYAPESLENATMRLANDSLNTLRNVTGSNTSQSWAKSKASGSESQDATNGRGTEDLTSPSDLLRVFDEL